MLKTLNEWLITLNECSTIAAEAREVAKRAKAHACKNTKRPILLRDRPERRRLSERWEFGCWFSKNVWTYTTESVFGFCDGCLNCRGLAYYIYRQGWQLRPGYCHDCVKSWLKVPVDLDKLAYSFCWIDHISLSNFLSWLSNVCKEVSTSQNWRVQFLPFQDGVVETKVLLLFL
jgi:hypothetical protein